MVTWECKPTGSRDLVMGATWDCGAHSVWVTRMPQVVHGMRQLLYGDDAGVGEIARVQCRYLLSEQVVARDQTTGYVK